MIENILIIDTETTGLDPSKGAQIIEIGALLFNVKHKQVIQTMATLLACDENPVQDVNHIDPVWTKCSKEERAAIKFIGFMARQAQFIVAHNAEFDKKFMDTIEVDEQFKSKSWLCTKKDFKWPVILYRHRLQDICEAMGVQYINAHRALVDATFLVECFKKVDDLQQRLENAARFNENSAFNRSSKSSNSDRYY